MVCCRHLQDPDGERHPSEFPTLCNLASLRPHWVSQLQSFHPELQQRTPNVIFALFRRVPNDALTGNQVDFRVTLLKNAPCIRTPLAHSSKAVGEPPFFLGASVFFALKACCLGSLCCKSSEPEFDRQARCRKSPRSFWAMTARWEPCLLCTPQTGGASALGAPRWLCRPEAFCPGRSAAP